MDGADAAHLILSTAAVIAAVLAWRIPRAIMWIGLGALSYVTSAWWHNAGLPYGTVYGAATNLAICYLFWIFAENRWEMRLWNFFHLMLVIDLLYIFGAIRDLFTFAVSLELINLAALLFICGVGIMERASGIYSRRSYPGGSDFFYRALWAERSVHSRPWWQK
jgi:hypothetical protein